MDWNLNEAMEYYQKMGAPRDQNALLALLREIQRERGCILRSDVGEIAGRYGVRESLVLALIRRIPSLRLDNTHTLALCAGPNCGKHTALAARAEQLHKDSGGAFRLEWLPCQRLCAKGPNIRFDGKLYHQADEALLRKLLTEAGIQF